MRKNTVVKLNKGEFSSNIKKLLLNGKRFILPLILTMVLLIISVVLQVLAPQVLKDLTDAMTKGAILHNIDTDIVLKDTIILASFYVVIAITSYFSSYIMTTISQLYAQSLREKITDKINKIPLSYFDNHQFGDILSRLTNDVDQIGQSLQQSVSMVIQSTFLLIAVIIAMLATNWQMSLTAICSLPFMIIFMLIIVKLANPQFQRRQNEIANVDAVVQENFSGQLIIKCFDASNKMSAKFEKQNQNLKDAMFKAQCYGGLMQPLMNIISYIILALIYLVGGLLVADGTFTFGTISAFTIYASLFQSPLSQIAQAMNTLQMAAAASKRVFDFLEEEELSDESDKKDYFDTDTQTGKKSIKGEVIFSHVSFSYDDSREIIHDFSATIKPGMKVAIVGPTGAGKTTMVNLLMRFYEINKGNIYIDGVNTRDMKREEIHDIFGMVLQDTWIFEGSLRENMVYNTPNISDERVKEAVKEAHLVHYVRSLPHGLDYEITDPQSISGGQKQLITIARAMIKESPLLILDEATSNVDTRTEEKIQEAMDRLTKGKTSFVIAHRLSTIRNADLILVMKDGNIIEQGTHDSLMQENGFYTSLYNSQFSFS